MIYISGAITKIGVDKAMTRFEDAESRLKDLGEEQEFAESKNSGNNEPKPSNDDFVSVPDNVSDVLPFE